MTYFFNALLVKRQRSALDSDRYIVFGWAVGRRALSQRSRSNVNAVVSILRLSTQSRSYNKRED